MSWTTPRTWVAGETVTAALMNAHVRDNLDAIGGAWTSYAPTFTNFGSTPTTGYAKYLERGKTIEVLVEFTLNASPTGSLTVSLPVTASSDYSTGLTCIVGAVTGLRQGVAFRNALTVLASTTTVNFRSDNTAAPWNATSPQTWASTDIFQFHATYEAAA